MNNKFVDLCVDVWFNNKFLISTLNLRKIKEIKNSKLNSNKVREENSIFAIWMGENINKTKYRRPKIYDIDLVKRFFSFTNECENIKYKCLNPSLNGFRCGVLS